mgnify:FL=1
MVALSMETFKCSNCNSDVVRDTRSINRSRARGDKRVFCSKRCMGEYKVKDALIYECTICSKKFTRRTNKRDKYLYCSRSCSNRGVPRRKPIQRNCPTCGKAQGTSGLVCESCRTRKRWDETTTLADWREAYTTASFHAKIRGHSRGIYLASGLPYACAICGYDTIVDVAHIKDIREFDLDTPVVVVNDIKNLVTLCPTHHREFDKGLIRLSE